MTRRFDMSLMDPSVLTGPFSAQGVGAELGEQAGRHSTTWHKQVEAHESDSADSGAEEG